MKRIMAVCGLALQKKPIEDIIKGSLKAMVGFVVISAAAGVIVGALEPFGKMFEYGFNVQGVIPNNEVVVAMVAGSEFVETALSGGKNFIVYSIMKVLAFEAVFGNYTGGRRGAIVGSIVNSIIISMLPVALIHVLGSLMVSCVKI